MYANQNESSKQFCSRIILILKLIYSGNKVFINFTKFTVKYLEEKKSIANSYTNNKIKIIKHFLITIGI